MSKEDYPLHDVYLNMNTHCTIDEAIGMLLNLMYLPKEFIQMTDEEIHAYGFNNEPIWSLQDVLNAIRGDLVNEYIEAKEDEQLQAIKDFDNNYIKKARAYLLSITDEIAKGTIRVDEHNNITLQSLHEWAVKNHKVPILEVSEVDTAGVTPRKEAIPKEDKGLSKTMKQNFYLTFVCLLRAFVAKSGSRFGTVGNITVQVLAEHLSTLVAQSDESIKDRIEEALSDVAKQHPEIFEKPVEERK
jgi:hypothetical protein